MGGIEALKIEAFRNSISPDSSELDARAGYGFSMLLSGIQAAAKHIPKLTSDANAPIREFFQSDDGERLLGLCQKLNYDRIKSNANKHSKSFKEALQILQGSKDLMAELPQCLAETAGLYLSLMWFYDGLIHANGLRMWAGRVPDVEYMKNAITQWKASKPTLETTAKFLGEAYVARREYEKSWNTGKRGQGSTVPWVNDDDEDGDGEAWQRAASGSSKEKKEKKSSSDDSSVSELSKKRKKKKRKNEKQESGSESSSAKRKKNTTAKATKKMPPTSPAKSATDDQDPEAKEAAHEEDVIED